MIKGFVNNNRKEKIDNAPLSFGLLILVLLFVAFVIDEPILIMVSFILACAIIMLLRCDNAIYFMSFLVPFSSTFVFMGRHLFFVLVALFILKSFLQRNLSFTTLVYYALLLSYSFAFSDFSAKYTFAKLMCLILLFAVPIMCFNADKISVSILMKHYIIAFVISTIFGFFIESIPAMYKLFDVDLMWTDNNIKITRFFGLCFDSNFYALSNYLVLAYLLLAFKELSPLRIVIIFFLIFAGVQTISKSYFLVLLVICLLFVAKNFFRGTYILKCLLFALLGLLLFLIVSDSLGYNAISMIVNRFVKGEGLLANTTGRDKIWEEYFGLFSNAKWNNIVFGFGFNSRPTQAAHNTFIEMFYYYGAVGCVLWGIYIVHCWKMLCLKKQNEKDGTTFSVLFCLALGIFFLSAYTDEMFWFNVFIALFICAKGKEKNV